MPKRSHLDIFTKSLKKRFPKKPEVETSDRGVWVVMPEKEEFQESIGEFESIEKKPAREVKPVRCLGYDCEYASYKEDKEGRTVLWCSRDDKKVYDIQRCPVKKWYKDKSGRFVIEGKGL